MQKKKAKKKQERRERQMNHYQRACQLWSVLVFAAKKSQTVTYKELSRITGLVPPVAMAKPLAYIQEFCLIAKLPPLTVLVVKDGLPSEGFFAVAPDDVHKAQQLVFDHNWDEDPEKTPATYTYREADKEWVGLSAKERGALVEACCESVQREEPVNTHAELCPKCKKAGRKR